MCRNGVLFSLIVTCVLILTSHMTYAHDVKPQDLIGIPGPLSFDGRDFILVKANLSSKDQGSTVTQIYIPKGTQPETAEDRLIIMAMPGISVPQIVELSKVAITASAEGDRYQRFWGPYPGKKHPENFLQLAILFDTKEKMPFLEWTAARFSPFQLKDGRKGAGYYSIAHRVLGPMEKLDAEVLERDFMEGNKIETYIHLIGHNETLPPITTLPR